MKEYIKPLIEDENIEIEDVIAFSNVGGQGNLDNNGDSYDSDGLFKD